MANDGGTYDNDTHPNITNNRTAPRKCFRSMAFTALSILGIYGVVGMTLHTYDLISEEGHGSWPFNHRPVKITLVILQTFLFMAFGFGAVGAWRKDRNFYFWACLLLLGDAAILAIFGVVTLRASRSELEPKLLQSLEKGDWEDFNWIDFLQHHHKCCGISSYTNWDRINDGIKLNPKNDGKRFNLSKDSLPNSCCKRDSIPPPKENCGVDILLQNFTNKIYVKPCSPHIIRPAQKALVQLGVEMLIVAFFTLAISLFLYCGATEMFCLAPRRRHNFGGAASVTSLTQENDDEDNLTDSEEHPGYDATRAPTTENQGETGGDKDQRRTGQRHRNHDKRVALDSNGNALVGDANVNTRPKLKSGNTKGKRSQSQKANRAFAGSQIKTMVAPGMGLSRSKKTRLRADNEAIIIRGNKMNNNNVQIGQHHPSNRSPSRNTGTKSDMFLQKLEMLYEGIGKNVSTLSTTPNPSGSLFFPWSSNNSSPPPPAPSTTTRSPNNKKATQLSHCSSVPHFPHLPHHKGEWHLPSFCNPHTFNANVNAVTTMVPDFRPRQNSVPLSSTSPIDNSDYIPILPTNLPINYKMHKLITNSDQTAVDIEQDADFDISSSELGLESNKSATLNIPAELFPISVEVTNAVNLINEDVQHKMEFGEIASFNESLNIHSSALNSEAAPVVSGVNERVLVNPVSNSNSSLGFESSSTSSGAGESSESDDDELSATGRMSSSDLFPAAPRKSKVRFTTLPTIVEEPEPNTPKKETPTGSDSELQKELDKESIATMSVPVFGSDSGNSTMPNMKDVEPNN